MSRDEIMYLQDIRLQTGMGCRCHHERSQEIRLSPRAQTRGLFKQVREAIP